MQRIDQTIYVPKRLVELTESEFGDIRTIENHLLIWHFIDSWPYTDETDDNWRQINDKKFGAVVSNQNLRGEIRKWLEGSGFLRIRKYRRWDGELVNHCIPDVESCKYAPQCPGPLVPYRLECKDGWNFLKTSTQSEQLCLATRVNLGLLTRISGARPRYADEKTTKEKKNRGLHSLRKLTANSGHVKRGHRVHRIFSPWVTASKEVRACFLLAGCGISSVDLSAAHPTLISQMSEDRKLAADCKAQILYPGIMALLKTGCRDRAKKAFMAYGYGKNRKNGRGNLDAFLVQEWMRKEYPKAAGFITHEKTVRDYEEFSCRLQDLEAEIFVDGIFRELHQSGVPALTVHDAIYFRAQDIEQVRETAKSHLSRAISSENYSVDEEQISKAPPYRHQTPECDSEQVVPVVAAGKEAA